MTIHCHLTESDYRAFQRRVLFHHRKFHWILGTMFLLLLSLIWMGGDPHETAVDKIRILIAGIVIFGGATLLIMLVIHFISRRVTGKLRAPAGPHTFEISGEKFIEENESGRVETRLSGILCIDETPGHFFVLLRNGTGHVIPRRELDPRETEALRAFRDRVVTAGR